LLKNDRLYVYRGKPCERIRNRSMKTINPNLQSLLDKDEEKQQRVWDQAVRLHHEKKYVESIKKIATYFNPDIEFRFEDGKHKFELIQGSAMIYCRITEETFYAYLNVLKVEYPDPIVFRRLLNLNATEFNQTKASIVKDYIRLTTETLLELSSPSKIFWDLHELAIHGDKLDDLLSIYSKGVKGIHAPEQLRSGEDAEIGIKYIRLWVEQALEKSHFWYEKNDLYASSWWLVGRIFSIIHCIHPEGKLLEDLNDIVEEYNNQDRNQEENIKRVIIRLRRIKDLSDDELKENLFNLKRTFQTRKPASSELIAKYLESSANSADRFKSLGHRESEFMALTYGLGLLLNNYLMDQEFTERMVRVYEAAHFDYLQEANLTLLKTHLSANGLGFGSRIKHIFSSEKKASELSFSNEKDLEFIIKKLRTFYDSVLVGE